MALSLTYCIIYKLCPDGNELLVSMAQDQRVIYQHIMRECVIQCAAKLAVENQSSPFPSSLREELPLLKILPAGKIICSSRVWAGSKLITGFGYRAPALETTCP